MLSLLAIAASFAALMVFYHRLNQHRYYCQETPGCPKDVKRHWRRFLLFSIGLGILPLLLALGAHGHGLAKPRKADEMSKQEQVVVETTQPNGAVTQQVVTGPAHATEAVTEQVIARPARGSGGATQQVVSSAAPASGGATEQVVRQPAHSTEQMAQQPAHMDGAFDDVDLGPMHNVAAPEVSFNRVPSYSYLDPQSV